MSFRDDSMAMDTMEHPSLDDQDDDDDDDAGERERERESHHSSSLCNVMTLHSAPFFFFVQRDDASFCSILFFCIA